MNSCDTPHLMSNMPEIIISNKTICFILYMHHLKDTLWGNQSISISIVSDLFEVKEYNSSDLPCIHMVINKICHVDISINL